MITDPARLLTEHAESQVPLVEFDPPDTFTFDDIFPPPPIPPQATDVWVKWEHPVNGFPVRLTVIKLRHGRI